MLHTDISKPCLDPFFSPPKETLKSPSSTHFLFHLSLHLHLSPLSSMQELFIQQPLNLPLSSPFLWNAFPSLNSRTKREGATLVPSYFGNHLDKAGTLGRSFLFQLVILYGRRALGRFFLICPVMHIWQVRWVAPS